jgi:hypothetical protein
VNDILLSATARLLDKHPRASVTASSALTIKEMDARLGEALAENKRLARQAHAQRNAAEVAQARLQFELEAATQLGDALRAQLAAAGEENARLMNYAAVPRGAVL